MAKIFGNTEIIRGRLEPFFETGTEGIYWSLSDLSLPGYDSLVVLENGDYLWVMDHDYHEVWHGKVDLEYKKHKEPYPGGGTDSLGEPRGQQAVNNMWVHGLQDNMDPKAWANMFFEGYRAIVKKKTKRAKHPFVGDSKDMLARLQKIPEDELMRLYRATLHSWLILYSDGEWHSLARDWDFSFDESVKLIGSPTSEQIEKWRTYPKTVSDTLMPFDWNIFTRVALLFGVYGGLDWHFDKKENKVNWMNTNIEMLGNQSPKSLLLQDSLEGIKSIRDIVVNLEAEPNT